MFTFPVAKVTDSLRLLEADQDVIYRSLYSPNIPKFYEILTASRFFLAREIDWWYFRSLTTKRVARYPIYFHKNGDIDIKIDINPYVVLGLLKSMKSKLLVQINSNMVQNDPKSSIMSTLNIILKFCMVFQNLDYRQ